MVQAIDDRIGAAKVVSHKMGTVISRESATALATVSFDGGSGIGQPVKCFETVVCDEGDRVGLLKVEGEWIIVGNYTLRTLAEEFMSIQYTSSNTNTSASYIDMPTGTSLTVFKVKDATKLRVKMGLSIWATAVNTSFKAGIHISNSDLSISTDVTLFERAMNPATQHADFTGGLTLSLTLPSASYLIVGRWLRNGGTGTLTMNTDDGVWIEVKEVVNS
jgi:hypothetical protein